MLAVRNWERFQFRVEQEHMQVWRPLQPASDCLVQIRERAELRIAGEDAGRGQGRRRQARTCQRDRG